MVEGIPWRSDSGRPRPAAIPLPGGAIAMPLLRGARPLKRWRYVGVFAPELMLCAAQVSIGGAHHSFWGLWDGERLRGRTRLRRHRSVELGSGRLRVREDDVEVEYELNEGPGVESVCAHGAQYVWTRKQGGVRARGSVRIDGRTQQLDALSVIDDTAGYHARVTRWLWCAGVGQAESGASVAWNLVTGVNDPPSGSERTVWLDGIPREVAPVEIADGLDRVMGAGGELRFDAVATRRRRENLLLVRSDYEQPFGRFSGVLPDGTRLGECQGVMERHTARW